MAFWQNATPAMIHTPAMIRNCVNAEYKVRVQDEYGYTPLHTAAQINKNPEVIITLLNLAVEKMHTMRLAILPHIQPRHGMMPGW